MTVPLSTDKSTSLCPQNLSCSVKLSKLEILDFRVIDKALEILFKLIYKELRAKIMMS